MATPDKPRGRRIRAVKIAFNIINVLQTEGRIGVTEIANELGYSKSTVHSHLKTLEEIEILVRENGGYRLSLRILDMAEHVRGQIGNYSVIEKEVESLAEETGEIVQFGIEEHGRVSYLCKAKGDKAVTTASQVGIQQPIYSTALGKTILAFVSSEKRDAIIDSCAFDRKTAQTITNVSDLRNELDKTRQRGYGIDDEENIEGLRCVAAPVTNGESVLGAVSISGPSSRFTDGRLDSDLPEYVQRAANVIEINTRFS